MSRKGKKEVYVVDGIVGKRLATTSSPNKRSYEYLVHWRGYTSDDNTWEPTSNLSLCKELIAKYNENEKKEKREEIIKRRDSLKEKRSDDDSDEKKKSSDMEEEEEKEKRDENRPRPHPSSRSARKALKPTKKDSEEENEEEKEGEKSEEEKQKEKKRVSVVETTFEEEDESDEDFEVRNTRKRKFDEVEKTPETPSNRRKSSRLSSEEKTEESKGDMLMNYVRTEKERRRSSRLSVDKKKKEEDSDEEPSPRKKKEMIAKYLDELKDLTETDLFNTFTPPQLLSAQSIVSKLVFEISLALQSQVLLSPKLFKFQNVQENTVEDQKDDESNGITEDN